MVLDLAAVIYYSSDIAALTGLICSSATLALVLGSELHHHQTGVPPDHTHISALIRSAVRILNSTFKGVNILLKNKKFCGFHKMVPVYDNCSLWGYILIWQTQFFHLPYSGKWLSQKRINYRWRNSISGAPPIALGYWTDCCTGLHRRYYWLIWKGRGRGRITILSPLSLPPRQHPVLTITASPLPTSLALRTSQLRQRRRYKFSSGLSPSPYRSSILDTETMKIWQQKYVFSPFHTLLLKIGKYKYINCNILTMVSLLHTFLRATNSCGFQWIMFKHHVQASCDYPLGGTWTRLYSSSQHGFSMNRFQHHCSDYREPSVMVLDCRCQRGEEEGGDGRHQFAIAVDTEWKSASCSWSCSNFANHFYSRDGTFYWGGERFCLLQLQPVFLLLSCKMYIHRL